LNDDRHYFIPFSVNTHHTFYGGYIMSLPITWIDKIFEKMSLIYGREFLARWEGLELDIVKDDWAHELAGFENWPEAIKHALEHMPPDRAPTVLQFRDICRKAPARVLKALPEPEVDPERLKRELAKLSELCSQLPGTADPKDHKAWARHILDRKAAGDSDSPPTPFSVRCAREALGREVA